MLRHLITGLSLVALVVATGCSPQANVENDNTNATSAAADSAATTQCAFCKNCGHAKGTDVCCDENAEKCADCGLAKGSTLCCVDLPEELKGKELCTKCGFVCGSDECCKDGAEVCQGCQLHKGSPLCCKLTKTDATEDAEAPANEEAPAE